MLKKLKIAVGFVVFFLGPPIVLAFGTDYSVHDQRIAMGGVIAGALGAFVLPWLWRWPGKS